MSLRPASGIKVAEYDTPGLKTENGIDISFARPPGSSTQARTPSASSRASVSEPKSGACIVVGASAQPTRPATVGSLSEPGQTTPIHLKIIRCAHVSHDHRCSAPMTAD
jgi:hypothetical protein